MSMPVNMLSKNKAKVNKTSELHKGNQFSFIVEDVILPNGRRAEMASVRHPGSTAVVPLLGERTVILERQYRHALGEFILEIPAGTMEAGESPIHCARRELKEETGFVADQLIELARIDICPAYSDEEIYLFLARGLRSSKQNLDMDEIIEVLEFPLDRALQMIVKGKITDALTVLALQRAWFYLNAQ
jgi:ADP-ribose pyrophosphatase